MNDQQPIASFRKVHRRNEFEWELPPVLHRSHSESRPSRVQPKFMKSSLKNHWKSVVSVLNWKMAVHNADPSISRRSKMVANPADRRGIFVLLLQGVQPKRPVYASTMKFWPWTANISTRWHSIKCENFSKNGIYAVVLEWSFEPMKVIKHAHTHTQAYACLSADSFLSHLSLHYRRDTRW